MTLPANWVTDRSADTVPSASISATELMKIYESLSREHGPCNGLELHNCPFFESGKPKEAVKINVSLMACCLDLWQRKTSARPFWLVKKPRVLGTLSAFGQYQI